jgi:hypothetical protein
VVDGTLLKTLLKESLFTSFIIIASVFKGHSWCVKINEVLFESVRNIFNVSFSHSVKDSEHFIAASSMH